MNFCSADHLSISDTLCWPGLLASHVMGREQTVSHQPAMTEMEGTWCASIDNLQFLRDMLLTTPISSSRRAQHLCDRCGPLASGSKRHKLLSSLGLTLAKARWNEGDNWVDILSHIFSPTDYIFKSFVSVNEYARRQKIVFAEQTGITTFLWGWEEEVEEGKETSLPWPFSFHSVS